MKKTLKNLFIFILLFVTAISFTGCKKNEKIIRVCASELPHADILNNVVKEKLKEKGYTLEVTVLDWTMQNDAVANKDYDANYFQHTQYLSQYNGKTKLIATCKVHYEPLSIYYGKSDKPLSEGKTFAICSDESNAIRALNLLYSKGVISELPVSSDNHLTFSGSTWTSSNNITITLIEESLLSVSLLDYDFACLPCNTAYTGNVSDKRLVASEDDPDLVAKNANILAVRENDYKNDSTYKKKIDLLTDILLSDDVSNYVKQKYGKILICDKTSQIDLR